MTDFLHDPDFQDELRVQLPDNPVMYAGWIGCMEWASNHSVMVASYKEMTGAKHLNPNDRADMLLFVRWANEMIWGDPDATTDEGEQNEDS